MAAASVLLTAALAGSAGCSGVGVRIYGEPHRDDHRRDDHETLACPAYLPERHREYWQFRTLDRREQEKYGQWRHDHPIAIETTSRPADRRDDDAYSTEPTRPHERGGWVFTERLSDLPGLWARGRVIVTDKCRR